MQESGWTGEHGECMRRLQSWLLSSPVVDRIEAFCEQHCSSFRDPEAGEFEHHQHQVANDFTQLVETALQEFTESESLGSDALASIIEQAQSECPKAEKFIQTLLGALEMIAVARLMWNVQRYLNSGYADVPGLDGTMTMRRWPAQQWMTWAWCVMRY
eukprot:gnl/MRDRNA2_/MRDRNA2_124650_c0_seq1.p2 gnl/MRDRNA2_/MRDRNA2_124650_c0~~gnl/MRDRNA2_/MRDRNA2_124650_c0_seq1.p2  ORF type:complete len:158 (+),score=31.16 gnl/MRDRNA2_/MRDRNA2_124650_c0_seq1:62-535(+)